MPDTVVENWVYRHWRDFQQWLPVNPLEWQYEVRVMTNDDILSVGHVGDWMKTLDGWGDDLFEGHMRKTTWLGRHLLEFGIPQHQSSWLRMLGLGRILASTAILS